MSAAAVTPSLSDELISFHGSDENFRQRCRLGFSAAIEKGTPASIDRAFSVLGSQVKVSHRTVEKVIMMLEELQALSPSPTFAMGLLSGIMTAQSHYSKNGKQSGLNAIRTFLDSFSSAK